MQMKTRHTCGPSSIVMKALNEPTMKGESDREQYHAPPIITAADACIFQPNLTAVCFFSVEADWSYSD